MNPVLLQFIVSLGLAVAKQAAIDATPVAIAVAGGLCGLADTVIKIALDSSLPAVARKQLFGDAWDSVQTSAAVCIREGGKLAEEIVTLLADAAAADITSALGI
jgi:hypothetical protein